MFKKVNGLTNEGVLTSGHDTSQRNFQFLKRKLVVHTFNPSTGKAETGRSVSLRSAWFKECVQRQPSLGSEGKQKADDDVMKQGGQVTTPVSTEFVSISLVLLALQLRIKKKELQNKDTEVRHVSGIFLNGA